MKYVEAELARVRAAMESLAGQALTEPMLSAGIAAANEVRQVLEGSAH